MSGSVSVGGDGPELEPELPPSDSRADDLPITTLMEEKPAAISQTKKVSLSSTQNDLDGDIVKDEVILGEPSGTGADEFNAPSDLETGLTISALIEHQSANSQIFFSFSRSNSCSTSNYFECDEDEPEIYEQTDIENDPEVGAHVVLNTPSLFETGLAMPPQIEDTARNSQMSVVGTRSSMPNDLECDTIRNEVEICEQMDIKKDPAFEDHFPSLLEAGLAMPAHIEDEPTTSCIYNESTAVPRKMIVKTMLPQNEDEPTSSYINVINRSSTQNDCEDHATGDEVEMDRQRDIDQDSYSDMSSITTCSGLEGDMDVRTTRACVQKSASNTYVIDFDPQGGFFSSFFNLDMTDRLTAGKPNDSIVMLSLKLRNFRHLNKVWIAIAAVFTLSFITGLSVFLTSASTSETYSPTISQSPTTTQYPSFTPTTSSRPTISAGPSALSGREMKCYYAVAGSSATVPDTLPVHPACGDDSAFGEMQQDTLNSLDVSSYPEAVALNATDIKRYVLVGTQNVYPYDNTVPIIYPHHVEQTDDIGGPSASPTRGPTYQPSAGVTDLSILVAQSAFSKNDVIIPAGTVALIDGDIDVGVIDVRGELRCHPGVDDAMLRTDGIVLKGKGALLSCGSKSEPFRNTLVIELKGKRDFGMGDRAIGAKDGGVISLHGEKTKSEYVRLTKTMPKDSYTAMVDDPAKISGWERGDKVVITTSFYPDKNDYLTVKRIDSDGTITFTDPSKHKHDGDPQRFTNHANNQVHAVDHRAYVANLSRNIVIQGSIDSLEDEIGAHVVVLEGGAGYIDDVEFKRVVLIGDSLPPPGPSLPPPGYLVRKPIFVHSKLPRTHNIFTP
eukprot:CAMPEP_0198304426 /NCGR_PEP_ID=MMETSP1449-20131203/57396_1 /TAXON_ID=420275 /ORGANISM="Attheya septentrionalis, Strain CCMP2084" /LENGTH=840 /DNA_ID=CAMNT_0044006949 /DNA_START=28 /DNA_END=2553 /DNA_ORIENTATION=-